ncbi:MAG TPA: glycosyltransferase [Actinomycetota bacterium]|nr:glycosyltransferase [Actinomycetota bacterium]
MRVLLVNNGSPVVGGAEVVVGETARLLRGAGHEPVAFGLESPSRPRVYSIAARRSVERLVRRVAPDVAHVHNAYEGLTLSVIDGLSRLGVPVVMTLHDYRAVCPNGYLLARDGPCLRCPAAGSTFPAVAHRCVRGSVIRSAVAAAECGLNRRRGRYGVPRVLIAPSRFLQRVMSEAGLPPERIRVVPNPVAVPTSRRVLPERPRFLFAGRLVEQKGLDVLLDASSMLDPGSTVVICGTGRLERHVRERVTTERLPVELRGHVARSDVADELRGATAAVVPSLWFENAPLAVLEAAASGVAVVASRTGALPELVAHGVTGVLVRRGEAAALAAALNDLGCSPHRAAELGRRGRERVRRRNDPGRYLSALLDTYDEAVAA